jgi:hypothetical protein
MAANVLPVCNRQDHMTEFRAAKFLQRGSGA